jgi:hypothetical protein
MNDRLLIGTGWESFVLRTGNSGFRKRKKYTGW